MDRRFLQGILSGFFVLILTGGAFAVDEQTVVQIQQDAFTAKNKSENNDVKIKGLYDNVANLQSQIDNILQALAGKSCPEGEFVYGFDLTGGILCAPGSAAPPVPECGDELVIPPAGMSVLKNDSVLFCGQVNFSVQLMAEETLGVELGPVGVNSFLKSLFFFWGGSGNIDDTITLSLYSLASGETFPGTPLFSSMIQILDNTAGLQQIVFDHNDVAIPAGTSLVVVFEAEVDANNMQGIDTDGITDGKNWYYTGSDWNDAADLGISGDFIIRAVIEP